MMIDTTRWVVVENGPWTASGYPEIRASFEVKAEAESWARKQYGRRWRTRWSVLKRGS